MGASDDRILREISVGDGAILVVERVRGTVTLERPGRWHETLTLEQVWELSEALDAIATAASGDC